MPETSANPRGYWESVPIMELNDTILNSANSDWLDWRPFKPGWEKNPCYSDFVNQGRAVLKEEFGSSPFFIMKDPRCARLAPFWLDVFAHEDVTPCIVIPIRNVLEVANSLTSRNGFHRDFACLLWLRHVLDAEFDTRGLNRAFTTYDELLDDWRGLAKRLEERLGIVWPNISVENQRGIDEFLNPADRHHIQSSDNLFADPAMSAWFRETYAIMLRWAADGEDASDHNALDIIRHEFDAAVPAFSGIVQALMHEAQHAIELEHALHLEKIDVAARLGEMKEALASQTARELDMEAQIVAGRETLQRAVEEAQQLRDQISMERCIVQERNREIERIQLEIHSLKENIKEYEDINIIINNNNENLNKLFQSIIDDRLNLKDTISYKDKEIYDTYNKIEWLRNVIIASKDFPSWWNFLPKSWRKKKEDVFISERLSFDKYSYLNRYPDVDASGMDAFHHYITHGILQGRSI